MQVVAKKTMLTCKLCSHERREDIDALLLKRSQKEADEQGRFNEERLKREFAAMGVENPTKENMTYHWKNHCEVLTEAQVKAQVKVQDEIASRSMEMAEKQFGADWRERVLTPDEYLTLVRIASQHDLALRMAAGDRTGATIDQGLKSVDGVTKRKSSEALDDVRKGIGSAVEAFFRGQAVGAGVPQREIPEVVEGVVVREEES